MARFGRLLPDSTQLPRAALPAALLLCFTIAALLGLYALSYLRAVLLHERGELPERFAIAAGWGDIMAAGIAAVLIALPTGPRMRWALLAWNTFGLGDILFVLTTAASILLVNRGSMRPFAELPLSFLPTMVVPLILATHVIIFLRLLRKPDLPRADAREGAFSPL